MNAIHEDYGREIRGPGPSDRNFGFVFTTAFLLFGLWPLRHHRPVRVWCLALSGAFFIVTLIRPALLRVLNRVWTQAGILVGRVVNPVVTGLLFYLIFTPAAMVLRWLGKDLLKLRSDRNARTCWIERNPGEELSDMRNQF